MVPIFRWLIYFTVFISSSWFVIDCELSTDAFGGKLTGGVSVLRTTFAREGNEGVMNFLISAGRVGTLVCYFFRSFTFCSDKGILFTMHYIISFAFSSCFILISSCLNWVGLVNLGIL